MGNTVSQEIQYRRALDDLFQNKTLSLENVAEFKVDHPKPTTTIMCGLLTDSPSNGRLLQVARDLNRVIKELLSLDDDQNTQLWALLVDEILWLCRHLRYMRHFTEYDMFFEFEKLTKKVKSELEQPQRRVNSSLLKGTIKQDSTDLHTDINVNEFRNLPCLSQNHGDLCNGDYYDVQVFGHIVTSYQQPTVFLSNQPQSTVIGVTVTGNQDPRIYQPLGLRDRDDHVEPISTKTRRNSLSFFQRN